MQTRRVRVYTVWLTIQILFYCGLFYCNHAFIFITHDKHFAATFCPSDTWTRFLHYSIEFLVRYTSIVYKVDIIHLQECIRITRNKRLWVFTFWQTLDYAFVNWHKSSVQLLSLEGTSAFSDSAIKESTFKTMKVVKLCNSKLESSYSSAQKLPHFPPRPTMNLPDCERRRILNKVGIRRNHGLAKWEPD